MSTSRAKETADVRSYAHMMTNLSITKCHKMGLDHQYKLDHFIRRLIDDDKIHSFKTFVNNSSLFPKYWGVEKEYEVFHFEAEIVDIEEFIVVLVMSFKNLFDMDGKWGLKKEYSFSKLFSNFQNMWSNLPYIYRECVRQESLDSERKFVTPEWLFYWYYFVNFQGSQNISIVNLIRNQDRSEYLAHLHECYDLKQNGGMGETRLVYQPLLHTKEGEKVFYLDMQSAVCAGLMNRSLKNGVNVAEWDSFELNTSSTVEVQIYFLVNIESDYKEIHFELEYNRGIKFDSIAIKILSGKKPYVVPLYRMGLNLNNFCDLEMRSYMSNPNFFEVMEIRDLNFFENEKQIIEKECEEIEQLQSDKIAMEEEEIFEENHKTVEDVGGYNEFDLYMDFEEKVEFLLQVEECDVMQTESDHEDDVRMKTNEEKDQKDEKDDDDDFFQVGDKVKITSQLPDRYRPLPYKEGVIKEIVDSPIALYYGVELVDRSMDRKITRINVKAKTMEKNGYRRVIFVTKDHYVQCAISAIKKF